MADDLGDAQGQDIVRLVADWIDRAQRAEHLDLSGEPRLLEPILLNHDLSMVHSLSFTCTSPVLGGSGSAVLMLASQQGMFNGVLDVDVLDAVFRAEPYLTY